MTELRIHTFRHFIYIHKITVIYVQTTHTYCMLEHTHQYSLKIQSIVLEMIGDIASSETFSFFRYHCA